MRQENKWIWKCLKTFSYLFHWFWDDSENCVLMLAKVWSNGSKRRTFMWQIKYKKNCILIPRYFRRISVCVFPLSVWITKRKHFFFFSSHLQVLCFLLVAGSNIFFSAFKMWTKEKKQCLTRENVFLKTDFLVSNPKAVKQHSKLPIGSISGENKKIQQKKPWSCSSCKIWSQETRAVYSLSSALGLTKETWDLLFWTLALLGCCSVSLSRWMEAISINQILRNALCHKCSSEQ